MKTVLYIRGFDVNFHFSIWFHLRMSDLCIIMEGHKWVHHIINLFSAISIHSGAGFKTPGRFLFANIMMCEWKLIF